MYVENWLDVGESGDSGVAGGRNCVDVVQSLVLWIGFIGVKCQCARVTAAETLGRCELGVIAVSYTHLTLPTIYSV